MTLESLARDIYHATRTLRRSHGFAVVAVVVLALGIGATTAVFSLVNAVLLRPLPFVEPDRVVVLWSDISALGGGARSQTTLPNYVAWKERASSFEDMAALLPVTYSLTGEGEPERLEGSRVTPNVFALLGLQAILGRTFMADDEGALSGPVAVISEGLWIRRFGAASDVIGRTIRLDGLSHTVIGVVPSDFRFPHPDVSVWVPAAFDAEELAQQEFSHTVVARLERGTALSEAQAEMTTIARSLNEQAGDQSLGLGVTVEPLHLEISRSARPMLVMLLAAVGAVLLITCANVANLLLARATDRRRELALRKALGATDGRVLRQLLTENAVLACLGAVAGIVAALLSFDYLARLMPGTYPAGAAPMLDWRVLSFTGAVALLTVLLFGVGPALAASRLELNSALKKGIGAAGTARSRMRNTLVVAEIAVTAALLIAAGLLLRSYAEVLTVEPGFRTENILIAETALSPSQYGAPGAAPAFSERVLERIEALPGVSSADYVNVAPLQSAFSSYVAIEGRPPPPREEIARNIISDRVVSSGYLSTLGVPLIEGRHLDARDARDAPLSVVINQAMARMHWPDEDPVGARFMIGVPDRPVFTVVGVVDDARLMGLDVPPAPEMYTTFAQRPDEPFYWPRYLLIRTQGDPIALEQTVRNAVWEVDANQPVSIVGTMRDVLDAELTGRDMQLTLVAAFSVAALLLASVGLYGVLAYAVAQRTPEIGLRMALGAERQTVVRAVLGNALLLSGLGIVFGLAAALGFGHLLASFLFAVEPADPATFVAVPVLLLLVAMLASYLPARRAASIDPLSALRIE